MMLVIVQLAVATGALLRFANLDSKADLGYTL